MGLLRSLLHRDTTTDVLDLLTAQHARIDELVGELEDGVGNRRAVFAELADLVAAHATVEEKVFYPAVMDRSTSAMLLESVEEHLSIKRILADMLELRPDDKHFAPKLAVLKEQLSHHAHEEEEKELFPKVRKLFTRDELAAIGNDVLVMFDELMADAPSANVPSETAAAAELPVR